MEWDRKDSFEDGRVIYGLTRHAAEWIGLKTSQVLVEQMTGKVQPKIVLPPDLDAKHVEQIVEAVSERQEPWVFAAKKFGMFQTPLRTNGEHFQYAQMLVETGYLNNPRPNLRQSYTNGFMRTIAAKVGVLNAQAFGINETDVDTLVIRDSTVIQHWQHFRWSKNGRSIYDLTEDVARAFLETDLTVLPKDLTLEETSCFIAVPQELALKVWHADTGHHDLAGFYVTLAENALFVCACGYSHQGAASNDNAISTFMIPLDGETTVEGWIEAQRTTDRGRSFIGSNGSQMAAWVSLVVNTLLYIQYVNEDVKHDPDFGVSAKDKAKAQKIPTNKARRKFLDANRANCRYYILGTTATNTLKNGPSQQGTGAPLAVRFIVRGHWRNQPHGPGRTLRKMTWIQPHWKGPEDAPTSNVTHVVKVV